MHSNFKIKKAIIIALALMGSSYSLHSDALTMGDIHVKSALGQPLHAQVKINGADAKIDESCFTVASDDPDNGVMLKYNPSNALITIQSQHPVVEPATSLTVFNRCQTPSKRNYTFIVDAQDLSANAEIAKNETPKKTLDDKFHYQRTFNKLTKQTEQEHKAKNSPDRFIYEDHGSESRPNGKLAPAATMSAPMPAEAPEDDNGLSLKELAAQMGVLGDKPSKTAKPATKATSKALKETSTEPKADSNKSSSVAAEDKSQPVPAKPNDVTKLAPAKDVANSTTTEANGKAKTADAKSTESKPTDTKPSDAKVSEAKQPLSISKSEGAVGADKNDIGESNTGNVKARSDNPQLSDELTSMENRMGELQEQVTALYQINTTLEKLFKQISLQLTQVKKENDFLRSLALCLGGALLISGYFFADWLRRKKRQPEFDREPPMWNSPNLSAKPNTPVAPDNQFSFSNNLTSNGMAPVSNNNVFGDTGFAPVNNQNTAYQGNQAQTSQAAVDPFDAIPDFKASPGEGLSINKASVNNPLADAQPLSQQASSNSNWFDLGEPLSPLPEQSMPVAPTSVAPVANTFAPAPQAPAQNAPNTHSALSQAEAPRIQQFVAPEAAMPVGNVVAHPATPSYQPPAVQTPQVTVTREPMQAQPQVQIQPQVQAQPYVQAQPPMQAQPKVQVQIEPQSQHTVTPVAVTAPSMPAPAPQPALTITRVATPAPQASATQANVTRQAQAQAVQPTPVQKKAPVSVAKKDVIKVQPAGVMDDVDVFLTHGRTNLAIQLLQNHLMENPKESAVVWIFLLDLLAKEGKRREYEITANECRKHFNIKLSDFSVPVAQNDSIESFERISAALQKVWGTPLVLSFIDELIYNTRLVPRMGFDRAIFEELMFLREVAEEELRMDQTQIQATPASMTNPQVSDEFKQLAEDLKAQNQRKQDVNQYLSQFEFNLEELNK